MPGLRHDDDLARRRLARERQDAAGRADVVGVLQDRLRALGMRRDHRLGMPRLELHQPPLAEHLVHLAAARPEHQVAARALGDVPPEVAVRREDERLIRRERLHHLHRVAAGADDVAERLGPGRAVDVADDLVAGVLRQPGARTPPAGSRRPGCSPPSRSGTRTSRSGLRIFAVSAMKWTPANTITSASGRGRLLGQGQAVADVVGDVLDVRFLVVVRQDHRVQLAAQVVDGGEEIQTGGRRTTSRNLPMAEITSNRPVSARSCPAVGCGLSPPGCLTLSDLSGWERRKEECSR